MNLSMKKRCRIQIIYNFKREGEGLLCSLLYKLFALLFPLALITLASSCGLASYPVVYDPYTISSPTEIGFMHNNSNTVNPDFIILGYDIVYRIYDNNTTEGVSDSVIEKDASSYFSASSSFNAIITNTWDAMTPYRRLNISASGIYAGTATVPIYKIDDSEQLSSISINIITDGGVSFLEDDTGRTIYFNRFLGNDTTKNFNSSDFDSSDIDVPATYNSSDGFGVTVAFFCFTYGFTKDLLSLHGNMVYIGSDVIN